MTIHPILLLLFVSNISFGIAAQELPNNRKVDWSTAGHVQIDTTHFETYYADELGFVGDSIFVNDEKWKDFLSAQNGKPQRIIFPEGVYRFEQPLVIDNNTIMQGHGADKSKLVFDLLLPSHAVIIQGTMRVQDTMWLKSEANKGDSVIEIIENKDLIVGDWIKISFNDEHLITSSWAKNSVGQILQVNSSTKDKLELASPLRMNYALKHKPFILKIVPVENIGIECLGIERKDATPNHQTSNIYMSYTVNSWLKNISFNFSNFSHVDIRNSSNITVRESYFRNGFSYGGGGKAYGVIIQSTSNEVLIQNNIFNMLRHAMIVQSGANGNVFAYNFSIHPFWDEGFFPTDAAGDVVLHGNYPYANLFEHNLCRNIVIDNSHGSNGPFNTFYRNRADGFGIFFSASNSPSQNIIGNEITNKEPPYNLVNYTILGEDHFLYGNYVKGTYIPSGTNTEIATSLFFKNLPYFLMDNFTPFGPPEFDPLNHVPASKRWESSMIFQDCESSTTSNRHHVVDRIEITPNPFRNFLDFNIHIPNTNIDIIDITGQVIFTEHLHSNRLEIPKKIKSGVYFLRIRKEGQVLQTSKLIKVE